MTWRRKWMTGLLQTEGGIEMNIVMMLCELEIDGRYHIIRDTLGLLEG